MSGPGRHSASLTLRLALALMVILGTGGTVVAVAALAYGRYAAQEAYDRLLIGAATQIAESISFRDGAQVDLPLSAFELLALAPDDRIVYAVFAPDGSVVTGYDLPRPPAGGADLSTGRFTGEEVRLARTRHIFAERGMSGTAEVVVGQTTRARRELAWQITRNALAGMTLVGLLMAALAIFVVRSALEPLRRIEAALGRRSPQDLSRLDVPVPREIGSLVQAMDGFMARLDRQVTAMRRLIGDASHQIRTPIAALRAQAELAAEETDPDRLRDIAARLHGRAVNLGRLADQLLSRALVTHRSDAVPQERLDLRLVAIRVAEEADQDPFATPDLLRLDLPEEEVWCDGDLFSLSEAGKNLLVNAFRHGRPPVRLFVRTEGDDAALGVADEGPGLAEADWTRAGEQFAHRSGVSPTSAGLGLSIVQAVAQAHRGRLRFEHPPKGGFEAALVLPLAGEAPP